MRFLSHFPGAQMGSAISGSNQVAIAPHVVDVVTDGVGNFIHALGEGYGDLLSRQEME